VKASVVRQPKKVYSQIILPAVMYRYEIWSLILREGHKQKVYENSEG
jgi:hypothetical protein